MTKANVMIVEDEIMIALDIQSRLKRMDYSVLDIINSGEEAVAQIEKTPPDIVLMDIRLKERMDGIEAARIIRSRFHLPVIFITACADDDKLEAAKLTLPFGYILKPFKSRDLDVTIQMALHAARLEAERREARAHLLRQKRITEAVNRIFEKAIQCDGQEDLARTSVDAACELTGAAFGWIGELNAGGLLDVLAAGGAAPDGFNRSGEGAPAIHHLPVHGVLAEVIRGEASRIINEADGPPDLPEGHPAISAFLGAPLKRGGRSFGVIVLADKPGGFLDADREALDALTTAIVQTMMRKKAEEKLRQSEGQYRRLLDTIPSAVCETDLAGVITYANAVHHRMLGYAPGELIGADGLDLQPPEFRAEMRDFTETIIQKQPRPTPMITQYIRKDGTVIDVRLDWNFKRDGDGELTGFVYVITDMTEKEQAEKDKKKMEEQLSRVQKMEALGTLAGGIAHDFNNILFPIMGFSEMLAEDLADDARRCDSVKEILKAANRARDLVRQILTFSRQTDHERSPLRMQIIVKEALKLSRSTLPSTIRITQNIDNACSPVLADPTHVHQICMNLITNAYHAMEDAGGRLDVGLAEVDIKPETDAALPPPGKYARLTVSDTGAGIDKAVLSRIFEPYFTTKDKDRGTGLGLALVHGIVKSYGGEITVETEIGKGTTFNIFLPCGEQESAEEVIDAINAVQSGSESILLVDDEEPIVRMEKQMLERLGYHVTARTGSLEALDAFKADPDGFDAVITDLTMPNLTGDKLAAALMEIRPDLPVILCTGFSEKLSRVKAANLGIKGYLMKPVIKSEIAALLRDVLSASRK